MLCAFFTPIFTTGLGEVGGVKLINGVGKTIFKSKDASIGWNVY